MRALNLVFTFAVLTINGLGASSDILSLLGLVF
jgi:hypothetical protein